jgi:hypothetical protein
LPSCPAKAGHPVTSRASDFGIAVSPVRIVFLDQLYLPISIPLLEPLLAPYSRRRIVEAFEMDKAIHAVLFGKAGNEFGPMFETSANEIVRDTNIYIVPPTLLASM